MIEGMELTLYRAWDPKKELMLYAPSKDGIRFTVAESSFLNRGPYWRIGKLIDFESPIWDENIVTSLSGILMKSVGLHTENKKGNQLIYEGDIVKGYEGGYAEVGLEIKGWDYSRIGVVIQKFGNTYYSLDGVNPHELLMYLHKVEVLGNKYENPQLLKQLR